MPKTIPQAQLGVEVPGARVREAVGDRVAVPRAEHTASAANTPALALPRRAERSCGAGGHVLRGRSGARSSAEQLTVIVR